VRRRDHRRADLADGLGEKGPHPDLDSDFELFGDVVVPALSRRARCRTD
jgi:hypothetical protein